MVAGIVAVFAGAKISATPVLHPAVGGLAAGVPRQDARDDRDRPVAVVVVIAFASHVRRALPITANRSPMPPATSARHRRRVLRGMF